MLLVRVNPLAAGGRFLFSWYSFAASIGSISQILVWIELLKSNEPGFNPPTSHKVPPPTPKAARSKI